VSYSSNGILNKIKQIKFFMAKKYGTFLEEFLIAVGEATGFFEWPLEYSETWRRKQLSVRHRKKYYNVVASGKRQGFIKQISKGGKTFLQLTSKGELERLMGLMNIVKQAKWDGKWRLVVFDIPEDARDKRDQLRALLKRNGFKILQASVFINPYPLNREALSYLEKAGLMPYIRVIKVQEMDNDLDLRKKFGLI
jgi:hypothetical protein